jgi:hypothetical protein
MWIWQEAVKKSSQWAGEMEQELGPVSSKIKKARWARPLKNIG